MPPPVSTDDFDWNLKLVKGPAIIRFQSSSGKTYEGTADNPTMRDAFDHFEAAIKETGELYNRDFTGVVLSDGPDGVPLISLKSEF